MLTAKRTAEAVSVQERSPIVPVSVSMLTEEPSGTNEARRWRRKKEGRDCALRDGLSSWLTSKMAYSSSRFLLRIQLGIRETATKKTAATPR